MNKSQISNTLDELITKKLVVYQGYSFSRVCTEEFYPKHILDLAQILDMIYNTHKEKQHILEYDPDFFTLSEHIAASLITQKLIYKLCCDEDKTYTSLVEHEVGKLIPMDNDYNFKDVNVMDIAKLLDLMAANNFVSFRESWSWVIRDMKHDLNKIDDRDYLVNNVLKGFWI